METMIDELAHLAGKDPVAFRLDLLTKQPRHAEVVRLAAEKSRMGPVPWPPDAARGFAFHHSFNTSVAMVAEISMKAAKLKVERIVAAVDCGVAIDPDVVTAQIEGAIGFALSIALRNQLTFKNGRVEQSNFDDYEPTRMREMPKVEVHIVNSTERPTGIGEPGVPPLAPAIANAIAAATGKRLRSPSARFEHVSVISSVALAIADFSRPCERHFASIASAPAFCDSVPGLRRTARVCGSGMTSSLPACPALPSFWPAAISSSLIFPASHFLPASGRRHGFRKSMKQ